MRRLAAIALTAVLACNPGFEPQYRVTDLRILGVRAEVIVDPADPRGTDLADPNLDDTVRLEALIANPKGQADLSDVDVTWLACAPGQGGALPPCVDPTFLQDPASLVSAGAFPIAKGAKPSDFSLTALPAPARDAFAAALESARRLAFSEPTFQCRIYVEIPIVVVAESATGRRDVALKRVRLVQKPADATFPYDGYLPNRNPVVKDAISATDDGCLGGTSLGAPKALSAGATKTLCAQAASRPDEYFICGADGTRNWTNENLSWQWYVTAGEFKDVGGLGNAEGSHLDFTTPQGTFTLWLILRDGRGGEAWKPFDVTPAP
ncbi:MAG TPA: hypothetical protein VIV57_05870 [Anaeromyxobacter sp.]